MKSPCWFCKPPLLHAVVDRSAGLCDPCTVLLADFLDWLHHRDRRPGSI